MAVEIVHFLYCTKIPVAHPLAFIIPSCFFTNHNLALMNFLCDISSLRIGNSALWMCNWSSSFSDCWFPFSPNLSVSALTLICVIIRFACGFACFLKCPFESICILLGCSIAHLGHFRWAHYLWFNLLGCHCFCILLVVYIDFIVTIFFREAAQKKLYITNPLDKHSCSVFVETLFLVSIFIFLILGHSCCVLKFLSNTCVFHSPADVLNFPVHENVSDFKTSMCGKLVQLNRLS